MQSVYKEFSCQSHLGGFSLKSWVKIDPSPKDSVEGAEKAAWEQ